MKKRFISAALCFVMVFCTVISMGITAVAVTGSGTAADPYLVSSASDLLLIGDFPSSHFKLTKNIQLDEIYGGWSTAGTFSGTLDGDGYVIIGLDEQFINTNNGTLKNLIVSVDSLSGGGFIETNNGNVENVYIFGGELYLRLANDGTFATENNGTIKNCFSSVGINVAGMYYSSTPGGFLARNNGTVENCAYTGHIWCSGTVSNGQKAQGFVSPFIGNNANESADYVNDGGKVYGCYYDYEETTDAQKSSGGASGKSSAAMKMQATYKEWDFVNTWGIDADKNRGMPYLRCDRRFGGGTDTAVTPSLPTVTQPTTGVCTLIYDANGGIEPPSPITAPNGAYVVVSTEKLSRSGYEFLGWSSSAASSVPEYKGGETLVLSGNTTLYAIWNKVGGYSVEMVLTIDSTAASLNGQTVYNDVAPIIENSRTMLPARFVAEKLGATVRWDDASRKVVITGSDGTIIEIYVDNTTAYVNGVACALDSPAFIRDSRTYTPVRFICDNLGADVVWDGVNRTVTVKK